MKFDITSGRPRPALAQLRFDRVCLSWSATGETMLLAGNMAAWQLGQVYPAGAVLAGSCLAYLSRQAKWNTST